MTQKQPPSQARIVAKNIIGEHGLAQFRKLIQMLRAGESGTKIGYVFGVTRQRICQWRGTLGWAETTYNVDPSIEDLLTQRRRPASGRRAV